MEMEAEPEDSMNNTDTEHWMLLFSVVLRRRTEDAQ